MELLPTGSCMPSFLVRVTRKVADLYTAYETFGAADWDFSLEELVRDNCTDRAYIYSMAALVVHHFGGDSYGQENPNAPSNRLPRRKREEFVDKLFGILKKDEDRLKQMADFAQTRMSWCFDKCNKSGRRARRGRCDSEHDENIARFRFNAVMIAGLWETGLIPYEIFYATLLFIVAPSTDYSGPTRVLALEKAWDELDVATIRSSIHCYLRDMSHPKEQKALFFLRIFNFSSVIMRMVHIAMPKLCSEHKGTARMVHVLLRQVSELFQKNYGYRDDHHANAIGETERRLTMANLHMTCALSTTPRVLEPDFAFSPFHKSHARLTKMCILMWSLSDMIRTQTVTYYYEHLYSIPKNELAEGMRAAAARVRTRQAVVKGAKKGMTFPFAPPQLAWVEQIAKEMNNVTKMGREDAADIPFLVHMAISMICTIDTCILQEYVYKFLELMTVLRDFHANRHFWAELCTQAQLAIGVEAQTFLRLHEHNADGKMSWAESVIASGSMPLSTEQIHRGVKIDYTHDCLERVCRLALLAGDDMPDPLTLTPCECGASCSKECDKSLCPRWEERAWADNLAHWKSELVSAAHSRLLACFQAEGFGLPFIACAKPWTLAVCTLLWRSDSIDPDGPPFKHRTELRKTLVEPYKYTLAEVSDLKQHGHPLDRITTFALHVAFDVELMEIPSSNHPSWLEPFVPEAYRDPSKSWEARERAAEQAAAELLAEEAAEKEKGKGKGKKKKKKQAQRASPSPPPPVQVLVKLEEAQPRLAELEAQKAAAPAHLEALQRDSPPPVRLLDEEEARVLAVAMLSELESEAAAELAAAMALQARWRGRCVRLAHARIPVSSPTNEEEGGEEGWYTCLQKKQKKAASRAAAHKRARQRAAEEREAQRRAEAEEAERAAARSRQEAHEREQDDEISAQELEDALRASEIEHARALEEQAREEAAISAAMGSTSLADAAEPPPAPSGVLGGDCVICLEHASTHVAVPCGHFCLCADCTKDLALCPMCRAPLEQTIRIYNP